MEFIKRKGGNMTEPFVAKMPYGNQEIKNRKEAISFIRHHCNLCPQGGLMHSCSGEQAKKCNEQITLLMEHYHKPHTS